MTGSELQFGDAESIRKRDEARIPIIVPSEMDTPELIAYVRRLLPDTSGPWIANVGDRAFENWMVGSFGQDEANRQHYLTTYRVHASEYTGDARTDAEFCAAARALIARLVAEELI